jgi:peptidoglycan/xylan/chitin deacetylase (PgdA/CDA1 family)
MMSAAKIVFHRAGGLDAARWLKRKGVRILMYHRFSDGPALARQCAHIRKYYRPISMSSVAEWLDAGRSAEPYSAAVTVDDGYRDFLEVAHPIFSSYGIPVTVYLVSDFMDGKSWLWFDRVVYAFEHARVASAAIALPGGRVVHYKLDSAGARREAGYRLAVEATNLGQAERLQLVSELPKLLNADVPAKAPPEYRPLSWDEVRSLAAGGVEFGAHTRTHPILSAVPDAEQLRDEIAGSKARIEAELGRPVEHFCYPNGRTADIGPAAVEAVRNAGFRTAVTAEPGLNHPRADPLLLRRIGADPGHAEMYFQRAVAAFRI